MIKIEKLLNIDDKIFVAGHNGMVGKSVCRSLKKKGYNNVITCERKKLDLEISSDVDDFINENKPKVVVLAAAKVGGIYANNKFPGDFILKNLMIQTNLIKSSWNFNVKRFLFLGSSCIYPKLSKQPIKEKYLLTGKLEETNDAYAIAKITGIKMCEAYNNQYKTNYICLMPTNLYGPNDNYDLDNSHFYPALILKTYNAKVNKFDQRDIQHYQQQNQRYHYHQHRIHHQHIT